MLPKKGDPEKGDLLLRHLWKGDPKLECRSLWQYNETIVIDNVKQYTVLNSSFRDWYKSFELQYLYFLSKNEPIEIGDYVIDVQFKKLIQILTKLELDLINRNYSDFIFKVVASTDPNLGLGRPSNEFLAKFCKEKGNIEEVLIGYDDYGVKISKDNTVTIKATKSLWSREEIIQLLNDYDEFTKNNKVLCTIGSSGIKFTREDWIKQHL